MANEMTVQFTSNAIGMIVRNPLTISSTRAETPLSVFFPFVFSTANSSADDMFAFQLFRPTSLISVNVGRVKSSLNTVVTGLYTIDSASGETCSVVASLVPGSASGKWTLSVVAQYEKNSPAVFKTERYDEIDALASIISQREVKVDFSKLVGSSTTGLFLAT